MSPTQKNPNNDAVELANHHHLATAESRGKPLCGEASPDALIGSYHEHLDDKREFVAEVIGPGGKPATACSQCLALYPSLLDMSRDNRAVKRITPFQMRLNVAFVPNIESKGYDVRASGIAEIRDKRVVVSVFSQLGFTSADYFHHLDFNIRIFAPLVIPLLNKANKDS